MKKRPVKKIIGWLHLWLGIVSGLVVSIMAFTGAILVFEDELEPYTDYSHYMAKSPPGKRLALEHLADIVQEAFPKRRITLVSIPESPKRNIIFTMSKLMKKGQVLRVAIDPYSGVIASTRTYGGSRFFDVITDIHRYLGMDGTGKAITGVSCVTFLLVLLGGLILWWPKRHNVKQRFLIKWKASPKRLNWDLHAVTGFYVFPLAIIMGATGLVWSYRWVNNQIFLTIDGRLQAPVVEPTIRPLGDTTAPFLNKVLAKTNRRLPYRGATLITIPEKKTDVVIVNRTNAEAAVDNVVDILYFDRTTGQVVSELLYKNLSDGMKVRRLVLPIHSGSIYGLPTKILAFSGSLLAAFLPFTGVLIWLGRKRKKRRVRHIPQGVVGTKTYQPATTRQS